MSVIVLSQRGTVGGSASQLAYSAWNEAEQIAVDYGGARLGLLSKHGQSRRIKGRRVLGRAARRLAGPQVSVPATGSGLIEPVEAADHVVLMAFGAWDLPLIERLRAIRTRAKTISIWMPEVWPSELDERIHLENYGLVDHVFVGIREVVDDFRRIAPNADIHCVPPATDVMAFSPDGGNAERSIAVLGVGRRDADQHQRLLEWSNQTGKLYLYDTVKGEAPSWVEHRQNLAGWYRRSQVAICNFGKHDRPDEIQGLRIVPGRLFEGLAAGAVLIGRPPDEDNQREIVGDVVVNSTEETDLVDLVERFCNPNEAKGQRARNIGLACERHDWAHRWIRIFDAIGEPVPEMMTDRVNGLAARAATIR